MLTRNLRQLLAATLLLFILVESTSLASVFPEKTKATATHQWSVIQHELQTLFSLMAEQSEERDGRDDFLLPLEREVFLPHHFPQITTKCMSYRHKAPSSLRPVPIYTTCCAYLI